jgi:hypothetical protein
MISLMGPFFVSRYDPQQFAIAYTSTSVTGGYGLSI